VGKEVYLDNNATTKCDEKVLNAMLPYLNESYGNPSSLYSFSKNVKEKIVDARRYVAKLLNVEEREILLGKKSKTK